MAEGALKFVDFAERYSAKYKISSDQSVERVTLIINPIVVAPDYFNFGDFDDSGKILSEIAVNTDKIDTNLNGWDDIGVIDMIIQDVLKSGIRIPEAPKLKNYLYNFPELLAILPLVCTLTREKFPPDNSQLSLEFDSDIDGMNAPLILYVRQDHYEENIMEIIDEIRSKYSDKLIGTKGWLLVTTDFASPE